MAYTTIDNPGSFFNTVLYTGNASGQSITGVGFQPDWLWIKSRSAAYQHSLRDVIRGSTKTLRSNGTNAEQTQSDSVTSFDSDGFTLGADSSSFVNQDGATYVGWNWKAGGSASSNGDGSISSTVSVNTTAGFSIVSYTGTGSAATVGHGLGVAPKLIIIKNRSSSESWRVYHNVLGATKEIYLDLTASAGTSSSSFNDTEPTSSVFSVGTGNGTNKSSENLIAYCFAEKKGYSKFGSYTGNGNDDGTFVYTGFKPAFIIIKPSSKVEEWTLLDNKRLGFNVDNNYVYPNQNYTEGTNNRLDILSNGFKLRDDTGETNTSGATMIYIAFAESPFVNSNGVPTNAR